MGIYRRGDSPYWWLWLERPGGKPLLESSKIRVDAPTVDQRKDNRCLAEIRYHHRLTELTRGRLGLVEKPTISLKKFAEWYQLHELPRRRGHEREAEILPRLVRFFGAFDLRAIDGHIVKEYETARLDAKIAANTVNREVDVLKSMLKAAVPKYLEASPLYGRARLRTVKPKRRLMQIAEERKLLAELAPDDRALFLLAIDSLIRLSDILDLEWTDVDLRARTVYIKDPKDPTQGQPYTPPLSKRTIAALKKVPRRGRYVFGRRRRAATERDRRRSIARMLMYACARAGLPYGRKRGGLTFHWSTRRTGATRMLRAKSPIAAVQKVGNWADPETVLSIYNEAMDADTRRAVELPGRKRNVTK